MFRREAKAMDAARAVNPFPLGKAVRFHLAPLLALLVASGASAQPSREEMALVRVAIAEAGFTAERDHDAIWHVLELRARMAGWGIERMTVAYSSPLRRGHWAAGLRDTLRRPSGFPHRLSWSRHREALEVILARAQAFLRGQRRNPCPGAKHWGNRSGDFRRAKAAGWHEVHCGTRNAFWR